MDIQPVSASRRTELELAAAELDNLIESKLTELGQTPNALSSDEVFLRRIYLDVAGRIPTLAEAKTFLESNNPDKRVELIDQLLSSPDYVSNTYNFWADTLRLRERPQPNIVLDPFLAYVKDAIRTNMPYDQWVYEMLTAEGKVWENPATGFQLRDDGMPLPYVDNTVRVFLGTQIGCAQCHDHPFDQWSQYQFYELAAYTAGTRTRIKKGDPGFTKGNPANELINEAKKHYDKGRVPGAFQRMVRANTYNVSEVKTNLRLPHDYAYDDAKPKSVVEPAVLWGEVPTKSKQASPRHQFAAWLTSEDNQQFSNTIVNRLWKRFLGVGLVEPIDDFRDEHPCANEPAMAMMGKELVRSGYNLRDLTRIILYSQTYQRSASDYQLTSGEPYYFPGPIVRRMTAEQVWDSMLTLAVRNSMPFQRPGADQLKPYLDVDFSTLTFDQAKSQSEEFAKTYFLAAYNRSLNQHAYQGNVLCRASELPAPQKPDHFLRQFGQSDRETIDGSETEATVPQILAMFNGPITHVMLEPGSAIVDDVLAIEQTRDRVEAIFLSVLARRPASKDRLLAAKELSRMTNDNVGYGNIIWALLNTREFLFIQ
ncbi:DUF1549 and DUF1553 domain-containing protein [Stieleria sp. TO1_6]|uniref:DUF1549 and DUF1553 domain-containing protein n=1 Tax=Stieleria tagensis TaxID=2956795 RepID=UPI00209B1102|nr:DUF1549 and DUF1553 domain-containing protein [Stieleria tagensis]MCO8120229.1 DUF1549 and DUF1553 domain-containing protein [Stieleria tagensis]